MSGKSSFGYISAAKNKHTLVSDAKFKVLMAISVSSFYLPGTIKVSIYQSTSFTKHPLCLQHRVLGSLRGKDIQGLYSLMGKKEKH